MGHSLTRCCNTSVYQRASGSLSTLAFTSAPSPSTPDMERSALSERITRLFSDFKAWSGQIAGQAHGTEDEQERRVRGSRSASMQRIMIPTTGHVRMLPWT